MEVIRLQDLNHILAGNGDPISPLAFPGGTARPTPSAAVAGSVTKKTRKRRGQSFRKFLQHHSS